MRNPTWLELGPQPKNIDCLVGGKQRPQKNKKQKSRILVLDPEKAGLWRNFLFRPNQEGPRFAGFWKTNHLNDLHEFAGISPKLKSQIGRTWQNSLNWWKQPFSKSALTLFRPKQRNKNKTVPSPRVPKIRSAAAPAEVAVRWSKKKGAGRGMFSRIPCLGFTAKPKGQAQVGRKQNEDWGVPEKRKTCFLIRRKQDETGGPQKKTLDPFEGSTRRLCFHQLALDAVAHPFLARTRAREEGPLAVLGGWPQGCPKASYAEEPLGQPPPLFHICSACQG